MAVKKQVARKPPKKFIDRLREELTKAGIKFKTDGWMDCSTGEDGKMSKERDDRCEWVEIILHGDNGHRYVVEFYFDKNATRLLSVDLAKRKKNKGYGIPNIIARGKEKPRPQPEPEKQVVILNGTNLFA